MACCWCLCQPNGECCVSYTLMMLCRLVVKEVGAWFPDSVLLAAGWSLGGVPSSRKHASHPCMAACRGVQHRRAAVLPAAANILVRYLGEEGPRTPVSAAVSMCNPFDLVSCPTLLSWHSL